MSKGGETMGKNKQKQATITEGSQPGTFLESPYRTQIPGGKEGPALRHTKRYARTNGKCDFGPSA